MGSTELLSGGPAVVTFLPDYQGSERMHSPHPRVTVLRSPARVNEVLLATPQFLGVGGGSLGKFHVQTFLFFTSSNAHSYRSLQCKDVILLVSPAAAEHHPEASPEGTAMGHGSHKGGLAVADHPD